MKTKAKHKATKPVSKKSELEEDYINLSQHFTLPHTSPQWEKEGDFFEIFTTFDETITTTASNRSLKK